VKRVHVASRLTARGGCWLGLGFVVG
jgi:hypothetical protein